jgi:hypothetical protein
LNVRFTPAKLFEAPTGAGNADGDSHGATVGILKFLRDRFRNGKDGAGPIDFNQRRRL